MVSICLSKTQDELWKNKFSSHVMEMIVTRPGRKMFPKLEYVVEGLKEDAHYAMVLEIEDVDENRYKFSNGSWILNGRADERKVPVKRIWHAHGVMTGKQWMRDPIDFERVKITNNENDTCPSNIFLYSMQKYIPVLSIYESSTNSPFAVESQASRCVATCRIPYTEFIAVTAYQNQAVKLLKIENNKFAKGFRDIYTTSENRKRSSPRSDDGSTSEEASTSEDASQLSSPLPKRTRTSLPVVPLQSISPTMFQYNPLPYSPYFFSHFLPFFQPFQFPNLPDSFPSETNLEKQ